MMEKASIKKRDKRRKRKLTVGEKPPSENAVGRQPQCSGMFAVCTLLTTETTATCLSLCRSRQDLL